jgi:Zn ribbon nucleic-acid-binding protein
MTGSWDQMWEKAESWADGYEGGEPDRTPIQCPSCGQLDEAEMVFEADGRLVGCSECGWGAQIRRLSIEEATRGQDPDTKSILRWIVGVDKTVVTVAALNLALKALAPDGYEVYDEWVSRNLGTGSRRQLTLEWRGQVLVAAEGDRARPRDLVEGHRPLWLDILGLAG